MFPFFIFIGCDFQFLCVSTQYLRVGLEKFQCWLPHLGHSTNICESKFPNYLVVQCADLFRPLTKEWPVATILWDPLFSKIGSTTPAWNQHIATRYHNSSESIIQFNWNLIAPFLSERSFRTFHFILIGTDVLLPLLNYRFHHDELGKVAALLATVVVASRKLTYRRHHRRWVDTTTGIFSDVNCLRRT
jgi:hypothetical protein